MYYNRICLSISKNSFFFSLENISAKSECGSEFDCGDESGKDDESLHEAYEKMYEQWLKVCALWTIVSNCTLNGGIHVLRDINEKAKGKIYELETMLVERTDSQDSHLWT